MNPDPALAARLARVRVLFKLEIDGDPRLWAEGQTLVAELNLGKSNFLGPVPWTHEIAAALRCFARVGTLEFEQVAITAANPVWIEAATQVGYTICPATAAKPATGAGRKATAAASAWPGGMVTLVYRRPGLVGS